MSLRDRQPAIRANKATPTTEVVSMRFASSDLDIIEEAASRKGKLITEYIRELAIAQARVDTKETEHD